jgi:hypothetical protein
MHINETFEVLHPYHKLAYIGIQWGGPAEQAAEIEAGNLDAKDWQDEARKIVEKTVRRSLHLHKIIMLTTCTKLDGPIL